MGNLLAPYDLATKHSQEKAFDNALHLSTESLQMFKELGMERKHLFSLHLIFSAMDKDKSGEINMMEFFDYIDLERSRFSEKAFSVMDRNGSGEVDFVEFVLAVWNYCSFSNVSLVRFAFDLYDVDSSGEITHDEVVKCVREVWGDVWETNANAKKVVGKLDTLIGNTAKNCLSASLFQTFAVRHPMLLFPAFELQMKIQNKILGRRFWSRATEKRSSLDVAALNWDYVDEVKLLSRQTTSNIRTSMEEELSSQLQVKSAGVTSKWFGMNFKIPKIFYRTRRTLCTS
ncbi:hypothetical protein F443_09602 [Plasmopara halstedii]|uniref:EF-hand domain-containing protein n=1 Tax=Plasmopara halstedii TaxID=4781 RepID=A0A0P1B190_PLAHL|nr:hypothetical protein F443_09602 [Plasmopara halstedii]CEG48456.1 hypothetical protein F443_09602 [Plasmopara halstedii]|eukprot:XP_024584825.1 hypothetical protein F443_09602 [Plasmopara halstedii]